MTSLVSPGEAIPVIEDCFRRLAAAQVELMPRRRFAVAETLSHLERLVLEERAARVEDVGVVAYTARQLGRRASA